MINDAQMDAFLDHEDRCNCPACGLVIEHLSQTPEGLTMLKLLEGRATFELHKAIDQRHRR